MSPPPLSVKPTITAPSLLASLSRLREAAMSSSCVTLRPMLLFHVSFAQNETEVSFCSGSDNSSAESCLDKSMLSSSGSWKSKSSSGVRKSKSRCSVLARVAWCDTLKNANTGSADAFTAGRSSPTTWEDAWCDLMRVPLFSSYVCLVSTDCDSGSVLLSRDANFSRVVRLVVTLPTQAWLVELTRPPCGPVTCARVALTSVCVCVCVGGWVGVCTGTMTTWPWGPVTCVELPWANPGPDERRPPSSTLM